MKVLWVSNSPIGPAAEILGETYRGTSGTWIRSEYEGMEKKDVQMFFLCASPSVKRKQIVEKTNDIGTVFCLNAPKICYGIKPSKNAIESIQRIIDRIKPDVIHIWGTETYLSNAVSLCAKEIPKVVFVQGIIGVHKRYIGGYFNRRENKKFYKGQNLLAKAKSFLQKKLFIRQAAIEAETLSNCKNIITDNLLSIAFCQSIDDNIKIFQHPLLPNKKYFEYSWNYEKMTPHSIFTVFGGNAEKGLQQLLKAVSIVKRTFPDVKVRIPGNYPIDSTGHLVYTSNNSYICTLYNMIKELDLSTNVEFLGRLDVEQMANAICNANVFINPSCMEIHCSSLREALVVGAPTISAICGSALECINNNGDGLLYRYEEYEVLAAHIKRVFGDESFARHISENARNAHKRLFNEHSMSLNEIYLKCIENNLIKEKP